MGRGFSSGDFPPPRAAAEEKREPGAPRQVASRAPAPGRIGVGDGEALQQRGLPAPRRGEQGQARVVVQDFADRLTLYLFVYVEMQWDEQAFELKAARAYVAVRGQSVELNVSAFLGKVAPVSFKGFINRLRVVGRVPGRRVQAIQFVQRAAAPAVGGDDFIGEGAGQRRAVCVDKCEVRALFALSVIDRPDPAALMCKQLDIRVKNQIVVP